MAFSEKLNFNEDVMLLLERFLKKGSYIDKIMGQRQQKRPQDKKQEGIKKIWPTNTLFCTHSARTEV